MIISLLEVYRHCAAHTVGVLQMITVGPHELRTDAFYAADDIIFSAKIHCFLEIFNPRMGNRR